MITRSAFGSRTANLGDLYDARTDNFCGATIFRVPIPSQPPFVTWIHENFSDITVTDDTSQANSSLSPSAQLFGCDDDGVTSISPEEKLSCLAGLIQEGGRSVSVPFWWKRKSGLARKLIFMSIIRRTECLNLTDQSVRSLVNQTVLADLVTPPTHVVVQIKWGAHVQAILDVDPSLLVPGCDPAVRAESRKFLFRLSGNFDLNSPAPDTFEEALNIWKTISLTTAATQKNFKNGAPDNGRPMMYGLIPLTQFHRLSMFKNVPATNLHGLVVPTVSENQVDDIVSTFAKIFSLDQDLQEWLSNLESKYGTFLPTKLMAEARGLAKNLERGKVKLKTEFSAALLAYRNQNGDGGGGGGGNDGDHADGQGQNSTFYDLIAGYKASEFYAGKIQQMAEDLKRRARNKINLVKALKDTGIKVLEKGESMMSFLICPSPLFVCYYRTAKDVTEEEKLTQQIAKFVKLKGESVKNVFGQPAAAVEQQPQPMRGPPSSLPVGRAPPTFQHGPRGPCHTPPSIFQTTSHHSLDERVEQEAKRVRMTLDHFYVAVDTDVHPDLVISEGFSIFTYEQGEVVSRNVESN